jgi:hypothetical protein
MMLAIDQDWFEKMAAKESDLEIGAGRRRDLCRMPLHVSS